MPQAFRDDISSKFYPSANFTTSTLLQYNQLHAELKTFQPSD